MWPRRHSAATSLEVIDIHREKNEPFRKKLVELATTCHSTLVVMETRLRENGVVKPLAPGPMVGGSNPRQEVEAME